MLRTSVSRHHLAVAAACTSLIGATSAVATPASATLLRLPVVCQASATDQVGAQDPADPERIIFHGSGPVSCVLPSLGSLSLQGHSTFSGSIPKSACTGVTSGAVYHAEVVWEDGTVTSGTFTDFHDIQANGTAAVVITGTTDASSTRFASYTNAIVTTSLGDCGASGDPADKAQLGTVTYLPGLS